jgi:hypothetical protein
MITTYKNRPTDQKGHPGHHGYQRYYGTPRVSAGITDANDIMGARLCDSLLQRFPPAGRHTLHGTPDQREGDYGGRYTAQPNSPNMAAVPDRPTDGRGTTSKDMLPNQTALM